MRYVIARYYFDSLFRAQAESNLLTDIQLEPVHRANRYSYAVGHVQGDEIGGFNVIRGQIGRIPKEDEGFMYDTNEKDFIRQARAEFADVILEFCIIPDKKLLLIQQDAYFTPETAIHQFKNIYLQSNQSYVNSFDIDFILDGENVYQEIATWQRFTKITFKDLRVSNPDPNDTYAEIEDLIRESGSDRVNLELTVDNADGQLEGASINADSTLVKQPLALSEHGYGRGEITGYDGNGEEKTVKTYRYKKIVDIDFRDDGSIDRIRQVVEGVEDDDRSIRS